MHFLKLSKLNFFFTLLLFLTQSNFFFLLQYKAVCFSLLEKCIPKKNKLSHINLISFLLFFLPIFGTGYI